MVSSLEAWGIGLTGKAGPYWCNQPDDMPWLISGALTSMTFRRLAHAESRYRESLEEAHARGLLTPPTDDPMMGSNQEERDEAA